MDGAAALPVPKRQPVQIAAIVLVDKVIHRWVVATPRGCRRDLRGMTPPED